jgi:phosphatidylglycerophosphatase A
VRGRAADVIATWFGCGLSPIAPGTVGAVGALPLFYGARAALGSAGVLGAAALVGVVGTWAAGEFARRVDEKDPQRVVVDEVCGVLIALAFSGHDVRALTTAFVLFRLLDMWKPWPIGLLERMPGGLGIMLDDVAAGALAGIVVAVLRLSGILP